MAENVGAFKGRLMMGKTPSAVYAAVAVDANGKVQTAPSSVLNPLGYQQITNVSVAVGLTVPLGATVAVIVAEAQAVRWRDDGTNPTATVGVPLPVNTPLTYTGNLAAIKFFEQAASAKLNISYYN